MSWFFGIINYINPITWRNYFIGRNGQISSQNEKEPSEDEYNSTSHHLREDWSPEKLCSGGITKQRCNETLPDEDRSSQEPVCDKAMSLPEVLNDNEEIEEKVTLQERFDLPSGDHADTGDDVIVLDAASSNAPSPRPPAVGKGPSRKRKAGDESPDGGRPNVILEGLRRRKAPRYSVDSINSTHGCDPNDMTVLVPPTPVNTPVGVKSSAKSRRYL
ncbi:hypothetical protein KIN20_012366 [Parelaphostrongylus tenuis]|uniref:Uncharacterized protein n=1 Tax=Parelaphostrongylus tenuis TaxID=148309 RepID=A0AAD5MW47_PARTN|nr:hypothetical protein KIN20_012366 [Parelaphostrongylus tenuis]